MKVRSLGSGGQLVEALVVANRRDPDREGVRPVPDVARRPRRRLVVGALILALVAAIAGLVADRQHPGKVRLASEAPLRVPRYLSHERARAKTSSLHQPTPDPKPAPKGKVRPATPVPAATPGTTVPPANLDTPPDVNSNNLIGVPAGWTVRNQSMVVDHLARSYLMIRPPVRPGVSLPVVMVLHGRTLTPASMERISGLLPLVGQAITVWPAGYQRSWDAGSCCGIAYDKHVNDVGFLQDVIHQVLTTQSDAQPSKVYVVGYSNGGRMALRMACALPGTFAGVAAVEAVPAWPCAKVTPLPTVLVDSTGDPLVTIPTNGPKKVIAGFVEPTVGETIANWQDLDGCGPSDRETTGGGVTTETWVSCEGNGALEYDQYRGGSHHWPEGGPNTPSAGALITRFLLDGDRNGVTKVDS